MTRPDPVKCPRCGAGILPDAPEGLCLRCLLVAGAAARERVVAGPARLPERFGNYRILGELGRGAMGRVYRAEQTGMDRVVALKVISFRELTSPDQVDRFRIEAQAAASLDHPNIVSIHEVGEHEDWQYFSMRLVEGGTLAQWLARERWPFPRSARLLATVARAIQHAHERGVLHRDLKPGNILLDAAGEPHVADFGLARFADAESDLTLTGTALGTPAYMAPEQAAGRVKAITTAADVYGLGAVLFEMLTGRPPFVGESAMAVTRQVLDQEPCAPDLLDPTIPRELAVICLKCLEKEPTRRYGSAVALAEDLERWLNHEPILAQATTLWQRSGKWVRRKPVHAALLATVVLAVLALVVGLVWHNQRIAAAGRATEEANRALWGHLRRVEWHQAEEFLAAGRTPDAMAMFARFLRETPGDIAVSARLRSLLELRAFPLPLLPPMRHGAPVRLVRLDPSAERLMTVADDGVLRAWNAVSGALERQAALDLAPDTLELLADGQRLLARNRSHRIVIWNHRSWRLEHELGEGVLASRDWSLDADGRRLSLLTSRSELQLWDTRQGTLLACRSLPPAQMELVKRLGPDGETLVRGFNYGLWLWHPRTNGWLSLLPADLCHTSVAADWPRHRAFVTLAARPGPGIEPHGHVCLDLATGQDRPLQPRGVTWHSLRTFPDGKLLLVSRWLDGFTVLDAETFEPKYPWVGQAPVLANASPDDAFRVCFRSRHDGSGRLHDLATGSALLEPVQHEGPIADHVLDAAGRLAVTGSEDGTARLWDLRMRPADALLFDGGAPIHRIALSPDARRLAVACEGQILILDAEDGRSLPPWARESDFFGDVLFSRDGRFLAAGCSDGSVRVLEAATGKLLWRERPHARRVASLAFSPGGDSLASVGADGLVCVFETVSGRPRFAPVQHGNSVWGSSFSPDGRLLATAGGDATARVWESATGRPVGSALQHQGGVSHACFSPDGRHLLTASFDRTAQVWEVETGTKVAPVIRADRSLTGARYSADGRLILIRTLNAARLFDARTSLPVTPPMLHGDRVMQADFSPDGRWIATGSEDGTARVWEARTGFPITDPLPHRGMVTSLAWLPDGRHLLTGARDGRVRSWTLPDTTAAPEWLPDLAEALAGKKDDRAGQDPAVPVDRLQALRQRALAQPTDGAPQGWLRWFLFDRLENSVRPPPPPPSPAREQR